MFRCEKELTLDGEYCDSNVTESISPSLLSIFVSNFLFSLLLALFSRTGITIAKMIV